MSFRGRSFRSGARGFTHPPRGGNDGPPLRGGSFRLPKPPKPASYVGHSAASPDDNYSVSEPAVFAARDKPKKTLLPDPEPDEQVFFVVLLWLYRLKCSYLLIIIVITRIKFMVLSSRLRTTARVPPFHLGVYKPRTGRIGRTGQFANHARDAPAYWPHRP